MSVQSPAPAASSRYLSIDFYRGLTVAFMIIVNTPGTGEHVYAPLQHAIWHGCTPTDLVFPSFMFIIGVSMWFSFAKYQRRWSPALAAKILRRTALIFLIGLLMNQFPFWGRQLDSWRIMGVMQRLALGYGLAAVLVLSLGRRALIAVSVAILLLYWGLLLGFAMPDADPYGPDGNAVLRLDRWLFGESHLYRELVAPGIRIPFDPEGLLSILPAVVTVVLGWLSGEMMSGRSKQKDLLVRDLLVLGLVLGFLGLAWDLFFPINKKLWTSSYVLYAGGISMILLAVSIWFIDIRGWRNGPGLFLAFGSNPLFAYVLSECLIMSLDAITISSGGVDMTGREWIYQHWFEPLEGAAFSSMLFALAYTMCCWLLCRWLYVRNILIKI
ncbi:MAG: DUF1624 domain-containing protein [Lewinellaceae bacterium]|nr:DUF1624 domain-containing protein [Saprospiraceae bacterium]MCB9306318.1 DUF1624 domain-containing protein [Lewinellaceae bacterium]